MSLHATKLLAADHRPATIELCFTYILVSQLLNIMDDLTLNLEPGRQTDCIYMDF